MATMNMIQAVRSGLDVMLERDDTVCVFGEDAGYFGGVFRATEGLQSKHGRHRVFDTPLAEGGIIGTAIGMGINGLRPVPEIQFADYIYPCFDQITNELAKNKLTSPTLFTGPYGGGKTSIARMAGIRWACEQPGEPLFEPCLTCDACRSILKKTRMHPCTFDYHGYIELDCGHMSPEKIFDLVRSEIVSPNLFCPGPAFCRAKTILLDEFGRFTETHQRKFLKFLETRNAVFMICCADEDKLDPAIRARCSIRPLRLPSIDLCTQRILDITAMEDATASPDAARLLAQRCGNNPREILKVLGDALTFADDHLSISSVEDALDLRSLQ